MDFEKLIYRNTEHDEFIHKLMCDIASSAGVPAEFFTDGLKDTYCVDYKELNELFNSIDYIGGINYISGKTGIFIIPTKSQFGKCLDIILDGERIERFYFFDESVYKLLPSETLRHNNGRLDILKKYGFDMEKILVVKQRFLKLVDQHHLTHHRMLYMKKEVLIPESEIINYVSPIGGKRNE